MAGKTEVFGENLPQCHFVHHKSYNAWSGIEPRKSANFLSYGTALFFMPERFNIMSCVGVTIDGIWIGWLDLLTPSPFTKLGATDNYSTADILHTSELTVSYALRFSVLTSRILATCLQQSRCNFKSHMKCSFHSVILYLPLFCNLTTPKTEFNSSAPKFTSRQAGVSKLD
jgi:hypothetical protein